MLRRIVLIGLMVLVEGMMQIIIGTGLAAMFLLLQVQASPYEDASDDFLASASSFALVVIFICSNAFKQHELVGLDDVKKKLSNEQLQVYMVDEALLSIIMICCVLGTFIVSFILLLVQVAVERARQSREELESKSRRLRRKKDHRQVHCTQLAEDSFHLFLSHVWGTGQDQMVRANLPFTCHNGNSEYVAHCYASSTRVP